MNKFRYFKISNTKKIRYLTNYNKKNLYVVFLHGFMSDLEGKKPKAFQNYCRKQNLGFLGLEYSGHGKSSGKFINGNISKWSKETSILIRKYVKKKNFVIGEIKQIHKKKIPKIEPESVIVSIQEIEGPTNEIFKKFKQKNSKEVLNLLGKNIDDYGSILDRFVVSRMPGTKVKLKLRKNKKIEDVILKLGSFDDKIIAQQSDLIKKNKYCYLGAWNFKNEIFKKEKNFIKNGGKFITHVPFPRIIKN